MPGSLTLIRQVYEDFGIKEYRFRLSYRDPQDKEKYFPDDEMWETSQRMLREVVEELELPFFEAEGEAAFYGPKLDVQIKTALGKEETLSTAQLDFLLPERFQLEYVGEDGKKHRPVVIHRGIISTMERMTAFLLENFAGALPVWLSPVQAKVIPVSVGLRTITRRKLTDQLRLRAFARRPICAMRSWGIKSAKRSWRKSRTCSSSARRKRRAAPYRCGVAGKATWERSRLKRSLPG